MPITENICTLRAVTVEHPDPGPGGMYATSAGVGNPIDTAPNSPGYIDNQYWRFVHAENATWKIINVPYKNGTESVNNVGEPGFTNENARDHTLVTLTNTASAYKVSEDKDKDNVVVIRPANPPGGVGVDWVVGYSDEKKVEIVAIPVVEHPPPTPAWKVHWI